MVNWYMELLKALKKKERSWLGWFSRRECSSRVCSTCRMRVLRSMKFLKVEMKKERSKLVGFVV